MGAARDDISCSITKYDVSKLLNHKFIDWKKHWKQTLQSHAQWLNCLSNAFVGIGNPKLLNMSRNSADTSQGVGFWSPKPPGPQRLASYIIPTFALKRQHDFKFVFLDVCEQRHRCPLFTPMFCLLWSFSRAFPSYPSFILTYCIYMFFGC